jgi:hypothetical protein
MVCCGVSLSLVLLRPHEARRKASLG